MNFSAFFIARPVATILLSIGLMLSGVVAYRFDAPLYFANATRFHERVSELIGAARPAPHLFVLDASGIDDVDYTGGRALLSLVDELKAGGVDVAVARATGEMPRDTARAGLRRHVPDEHIFVTVDDAVRALGPGSSASAAGATQPGGPPADAARPVATPRHG